MDDPSNGRVDHEDSDSQDFPSIRCYISRSNSPISDEPKGFPVAVDRRPMTSQDETPTKVKICQDEILEQQPHTPRTENTVYVRPRVRISQEDELKSSLDEIEFSGDETDPSTPCTPARIDRRFVDTSTPIGSVRHAVSRFGGTIDWKSHKSRSFERRKNIDLELEKTQEEIPMVKQQTEAAEEAKTQVLNELEATNQLIDELEMSLERAKTEEQQAKEDYELASLRVGEIEQGIAEEANAAANEELEVARSNHEAAVSEMKCVKAELESLRKEYLSLLNEKEAASKKAEEALSASKEVEKSVEELSEELVSTKESLESTRAEHLEAEEQRVGASVVIEEDAQAWDKELREAEEDMEKLKRQIEEEKDLKGKLEMASALLASLKSELAAYKESGVDSDDKNCNEMQAAVVNAKNELDEMKLNTEKAIDEVNSLKVTSTSLKNQLENEKLDLTNLKQREGMATVAVASLEAELVRTTTEIASVQMREKEAKEKMVDLPKQLQLASQEADEAKSAAETAREALRKAKEEAEQAKAGASTAESRLFAAQKEIEAARASEKLATDSIRALQESESIQSNDSGDPPDCVTLNLEEYYELSKNAQEAEEQANAKVAAAVAQIETTKEAEVRTLSKLEEANRELATRKEVYKAASNKAERASEAKLIVEQELRNWRAENEQRRKTDSAVNSPREGIEGHDHKGIEQGHEGKISEHMEHGAPPRIATNPMESGKSGSTSPGLHDHVSSVDSSPDMKNGKKKKKSFFPKFFMFFNKKKTSHKT